MAQILQLPKPIPLSTTGGLLAGAKLYTYLTGTSTPQSVYTDYGLSVAHANPVVADSNGVFAPMYWGNTNRYRLTLKTSADVTLAGYPVDDCGPDTAAGLGVPTLTGNNVLTGVNRITAAEARLIIDETDAGTDKRLWDIDAQAGVLKLRTRTDADGSGKDILTVTKGTTTAISSIDIGNATDLPAINVNGYTLVANTTSTGTLTGCTTSPTGTVYLARSGKIVTATIDLITGTSNTGAATITGAIPAAYQPLRQQYMACQITDNGVTELGIASVGLGSSTISLFRASGAAFTSSGSKGIQSMTLTWSVS